MQCWPQLKIVNYCCFVFKDNECCLWCFHRCLRCLRKGKFRSGSNYKFAYIREILGTFVLNANVYVPYDNISSLPEEKLNHLIVVIKDPYGFNVIAVIWCLLSKFVLISKWLFYIVKESNIYYISCLKYRPNLHVKYTPFCVLLLLCF